MLPAKLIIKPKTCIVLTYAGEREYILDALQSCIAQSSRVDVIIVIDGVAANAKLEKVYIDKLLNNLDHLGTTFRVVTSLKAGPSALRNLGIKISDCDYVLTLDADDKLGINYVRDAEIKLDKSENLGIVYGAAKFFGLKNETWQLETFNRSLMAIENQIYSSAMFRRTDWLTCGGYDEDLIYGAEDWDFWLKILSANRDVAFIEGEVYFWYRQRVDSRSEKFAKMAKEIDWTYNKIAKNNLNYMKDEILAVYARRVHLESQIRVPTNNLIYLMKSIVRKNRALDRFLKNLKRILKK